MEKTVYQLTENIESKNSIVYDIRIKGILKGIMILEDEIKRKGLREVELR